MIYISITGHQIMAILNPILAMKGSGLRRIELMATPNRKSQENAKTIKEMLDSHKTPGSSIETNITPVSNTLVKNQNYLPAHEVARKIVEVHPDETIYFNLAGGMNFQIAACTGELMPFTNVKYLYPDFNGINMFSQDSSGKISTTDLIPVPKIRNILEIQGINYTETGGDLDPIIKTICRKCGITLPGDVLKNVEIEGVKFDFVLNRQNTICFCKLMHDTPKVGRTKFLASVRELIDIAVNRKSFGDLAHHKILVLTNSGLARERFFAESLNKIATVKYKRWGQKMDQEEMDEFRKFFQHIQPDEQYTLSLNKMKGKALFAFIGKDAMPLLKTLWSFKGNSVCLFYTPGNHRIEFYKKQIASKSFPYRIMFQPVSFHAMELENCVPQGNDFEVNVTPGTKAQIFFLTRMAMRHRGRVNSINNATNSLESIFDNKSYPVKLPPMGLFLNIAVDSRKIEYRRGRATGEMKALNRFCREFSSSDYSITDFFEKQKIDLDGIMMTRQQQSFSLKLKTGKSKRATFRFGTQPNRWFEDFVGYVIKNCGADDVFLSLKTRWNRPVKHGKHYPHRSEFDVGVRFGNNLYFISCKAGKNVSHKKAALEIKSAARAVGRFAIPMLAIFKYSGKPKLEHGVWKFGYKTLADEYAMKELLKKAAAESGTTM